ncbi:TIGR01777 family oxidoreductase [Motiliproteus sp. MSK22-1]|uniref:TIGR01777 family oxidoreductase n=1 Tax=Motiliproteus sp. MSK22-1 TaxID=1897630 RepID=UPI00097895DE|nr:TIGR01777 family oxidoreductase [Motiliproteus sp. MSK22-1]OMH32836.1 TIGR01777 family protein [Motiliproteus sp. MSK22-1]
MKCLVTGATGFIGSALIDKWIQSDLVDDIVAVSRTPEKIHHRFNGKVEAISDFSQLADGHGIDAVVNLAGEPILDKRWSEDRKKILYDSRLQITTKLVEFLARSTDKPKVLISGSAIGYYGSQRDNRELTENESWHPCFAHHLCHDWENKAMEAEAEGIRVCLLRTGVVLGNGGALARMLPPFRLGLGGPVGHGRQWFSWIDLEDMVCGIDFLLHRETLTGPFNLTAPNPVSNKEFSQALGEALKRPAVLPMPAVIMRMLLGEGAELLVEGQRVVPEKLLQAGFEFHYPELKQSLTHYLAD